MADYEAIIGMEVHAQLSTESKVFCGCDANVFGAEPNTHVCPVCLGMPGVLPVLNRRAAEQTIMYYVAILIHGVIFGFFFVGGQVYVDKKAPPEIRAQAQGLIVLICFGIGMLLGTFFNVEIIERYTADGVCNWKPVFMIAAVMSVVLLGALAALFKDDVKEAAEVAGEAPTQEQEAAS